MKNGQKLQRKELTKTILIDKQVLGRETSCGTAREGSRRMSVQKRKNVEAYLKTLGVERLTHYALHRSSCCRGVIVVLSRVPA